MILDIFAEEGWIGEAEAVADLLDAEVGLAQVVADILQHMFRDPFVGGLAGVLLADSREVFWRDTQFAGIGFNRMTLYLAGM